jgi:hypothetical protein
VTTHGERIRRPVCRPGRRRRTDRFRRSHPRVRSKTHGDSNRPSSRRHARQKQPPNTWGNAVPIGERRIRLERLSLNASATRASSQRVRSRRKTARANETHPAGRFASRKERGPAGMETPKRDRPEAGRPGQRERDQRALQGTKTSREAPDQRSRDCRRRHSVPAARAAAGRAGRARCGSGARGALCASIDSVRQGGRGRWTPKRTPESQ